MENTVHKFKKHGNNIVIDVCSGGVHVVDNLIYDLLDYLPYPIPEACPEELFGKFSEYSREMVSECFEQLSDLQEAGVLFSPDDYEAYTDFSVDVPVKAMCLHVAHDCNLRCEYCFAETGDFGTGRTLMSVQTGKKAIDFLIQSSGERKYLEIDFFGGEPLMAWDTVTAVVDYARSKEALHNKLFRFTITTNGVLLDDEKIEYINNEMSNVVLSLDGRQNINDKMRPTQNGKGSYDIILPKFKKLVKGRVKEGRTDYYIRGTFTAFNLDFTNDVMHIAKNGFKQISIEPVVTSDRFPYAIKAEHLPKIKDEYDRLLTVMEEGSDFNFFHFNIDLEQGPCAIKRLRGCGAGNEYVAVSPDGDIYPCHQFVGISEWKMGNIMNVTPTLDKEKKEYFAKTHIYSKKECPTCWARFYCSGGCNAAGFLYEGDVRTPHKISCELMKERLECAIGLKVIQSGK